MVVYFAWPLLKISSALAATGMVLLYSYQTSLIYPSNVPPGSRTEVYTPNMFDLPNWDDVELTTSDGVKIKAYTIYYREKNSEGISPYTVLFCHANAGNMGHRLPVIKALQAACKCNVFIVSYRGYGKSEGSASEKGMKLDIEAAFKYVSTKDQLKNTKIVVFGQSIGGAVATYIASKYENSIRGLILENTFLSLPKLIPSVFPILRYFSFLCHQKWPTNVEIVKLSKIPILFLSGSKDELIPQRHMMELCQLVRQSRKCNSNFEDLEIDQCSTRFVKFENGTHNDTFMQEGYFRIIESFWKEYIQKSN
ncbi:hypothetical protein HK096_003751 [Nowakowskiella sp. JEL0078]|nr:hypothetical protein HK096_003751 [Nowakowskiella sp. JEL0078]